MSEADDLAIAGLAQAVPAQALVKALVGRGYSEADAKRAVRRALKRVGGERGRVALMALKSGKAHTYARALDDQPMEGADPLEGL